MMSDVKLYLGDCLEILPTLEDGSIDTIITDPPYSSGARQSNQLRSRGAMLRGEKWQEEWFGTDNLSSIGFMFFMRGVSLLLFNKCIPGGHLYTFIDWRNYPLLYQIKESAGWRINNLIVWNKKIFGMGNNYRNQHELIIYASKGSANECHRHDVANIINSKRVRQDNHPTEKPLSLIKTLLSVSTKEGDIVLDPFMGSGTTGVACVQLNRNFIGIEIDENYFNLSEKRIKEAQLQMVMDL